MYQLKNNAISPFDFVKSINDTKENLITDDWSEDQYNAFIVNKALSNNCPSPGTLECSENNFKF